MGRSDAFDIHISGFSVRFPEGIFPVLDRGFTAALFAATFFIARQIRGLRLELKKALAVAKFSSQQTKNSTNLLARLFSVEREIHTAYFRTVPPTKLASTESRECLQEVIRFARTKGTVRRIIAVPNKAMAEWCKTHAEEVRAIPKYNIRVLVTVHQRVEPTSVVTIDDDVICMAFSGPADQQLGGIREDAPELVRFHQSRFDQLWKCGTDVEIFLSSVDFRTLINASN